MTAPYPEKRQLGSETWPAVAEMAPRVVLVPVGSCEQHGPHLPLDTDTRIAVALAARLGGAGLDVLVACAGVTLQAVAASLEIPVKSGFVQAEGDLDFRGTLGVSKETPVGFTDIRLRFDLETSAGDDELAQAFQAGTLALMPYPTDTLVIDVVSVEYDEEDAPQVHWQEASSGAADPSLAGRAAGLGTEGGGTLVVHGHTPPDKHRAISGMEDPHLFEGDRLGLDGGSARTGIVTAADLARTLVDVPMAATSPSTSASPRPTWAADRPRRRST